MKRSVFSTAAAAALCLSAVLPAAPVAAQGTPLMGIVQVFATNYCPRGWLPADGRLLPIAQYTAMFSLYGTIYGGDGRNTFALPNLNGRVAIGSGRGPGLPDYRIGAVGGSETNTMTVATMPTHTHNYRVHTTSTASNVPTPGGSLIGSGLHYSVGSQADAPFASDAAQSGDAGNGTSFNNMQPYLAQTTCVAMEGIYPSRN